MNRGGQRSSEDNSVRPSATKINTIINNTVVSVVEVGGWGSTVVGKLQCARLNKSHQGNSRVLEVSDQ